MCSDCLIGSNGLMQVQRAAFQLLFAACAVCVWLRDETTESTHRVCARRAFSLAAVCAPDGPFNTPNKLNNERSNTVTIDCKYLATRIQKRRGSTQSN